MPANPNSPGKQLRLVLSQGPVAIPGVFNALTAKIAESKGFSVLYQSGAALSAGLAGLPDIGLVSQTEFAEQSRYLTSSVSVPIISDADTGFGEAFAVQRTVELFEAAGLAGLHIEDQVLPKRCGHLSGKSLIGTTEMMQKIRAAVAGRRDPDFVIIARTDARGVESLAGAIERGQAYVDAGADVVFPEALETPEEFASFAQAMRVPLIANMTEFGKSPLLSVAELGKLGYAGVLFPVTLLRSAMKAAEKMLDEIAATGTQRQNLGDMMTRAELYELLGYHDYEKRDRSFFGNDSQ
ncbi:MAG: methylisocitrate lyase [Planctomycetota bacterium]|nr:methylisocitrate lyase [Planctomycetota bacterium]MDA1211521.1 methylisocitrate lyase [Planctomycetota bacterium]